MVWLLSGHGESPIEDAPGPERVLSLVGKLDAAPVDIASGRRHLEEDRPCLEEHLADLAFVCNR